MSEEVADLRDALDHIWRVARASRTQSRRDRWIEQRALSALEGDDDWQEADYPRKADLPKQVRKLEDQIESLTSENTRLRALLQVVAEEDLDADAADGVTVLQVVIKEARDLLAIKEKIE